MASYCGRGATGKVYKEFRNGQWVAVKKVHGNLMTQQDMDREYNIYRTAEHPNIVKLVGRPTMHYDYKWHIPMEYIFGEDLEKIIFHPRMSSIQLAPEITSNIITGMCEGLLHLHNNNIVHQDLKPDNIMVESHTFRPVIIDMGFAKFFRDGLSSAQNRGNPDYAAPEIMTRPPAPRDLRSDVWAMGKIITELLIRYKIPHMYTSPAHIQDILRGNVYCDVVSRMLEGSPIPRATMAQVIGDIRWAGRAVAERRSMSTPSSMQVQPYMSTYTSGSERDGTFSSFLRDVGLPPNFHLPANLPYNGTVSLRYARFGHGGSTTQATLRIRDGRPYDGLLATVTNDDYEKGPYSLTYPDY